MDFLIFLSVFLFTTFTAIAEDIDSRELQCLICRKTVDQLQKKLDSIDSKKLIDVGQYRLDVEGNAVQKKIPLKKSEIYISETLEAICENMDNYARARNKNTGRLVLVDLQNPFSRTNPVDFIQDGDLNKSLKFLCEMIISEYEEVFTDVFQKDETNVHNQICTEEAKFCDADVNYDEDSDETDGIMQNFGEVLEDSVEDSVEDLKEDTPEKIDDKIEL